MLLFLCIIFFFYTFSDFLAWALFSVRGFALTSRLFPIRFEAKERSETFNVIFYFLAATLFMSHIRNAHSKRSNFLPQWIQAHMDVFSFNLLILIHFLHTWTDFRKRKHTHIYFYMTKRNKWANRKQIKMSKKKTEINFVKLSRFNRASPLSDRNQWFMMRSRGLTIDSRCLSDQWNWLLASQKNSSSSNNKNNENSNEMHAQFCWA